MDSNSKDISKSTRTFFSEWLEKLQQESWQLELIISGFALYGIYSSRGMLLDYRLLTHKIGAVGPTEIPLILIGVLLLIGWRIFFINLLIHVILRALWIGAIGLRYVSGEIDYHALGYSSYFTNYLEEKVGDYDDFIEKLEKICSVIFSFTFLLFLFFLSIMLFIIVGMIPMMLDPDISSNSGWTEILILITLIYAVLGFIVFIDFITLGAIKRIEDSTITKIYAPIYKFFSVVTFSFLYRPLLYNFIDSKYTRKFFYLSFPYILALIGITKVFDSVKHPHFPEETNLIQEGLIISDHWYADLFEEKLNGMNEYEQKKEKLSYKNQAFMISNYNKNEPRLEFFMRFYKSDHRLLSELYNIPVIYKSGWRFTLFSSPTKEDSLKISISDKYLAKYRSLRKEYNNYRDDLLKNTSEDKTDVIKQKKKQISEIVDSLELLRKEEIIDYDLSKNKNILQHIQDQVKISIGDKDLTDSLTCYYFKSKIFGDKGLLCNIPNCQLPKGNNTIHLQRTRYNSVSSDSLKTSSYKIPIYQH